MERNNEGGRDFFFSSLASLLGPLHTEAIKEEWNEGEDITILEASDICAQARGSERDGRQNFR